MKLGVLNDYNRVFSPFIAIVFVAGCAAAQPHSVKEAFAAAFEAAYSANAPGADVLVARDDDIIFQTGAGLANLELNVPTRGDSVYQIDSITKLITATAVLQLVDSGGVRLDQPISEFLPEAPAGWREITVKHLLNHTSGIINQSKLGEKWLPQVREDFTTEQLLAMFLDEPLDFEPGDRNEYNNNNYVVLGAVIERASGLKYDEFIRDRVFTPTGMADSYYGASDSLVAGRADGYVKTSDGEWRNTAFMSMTHPYAAGAVLSSVRDLFVWHRAFMAGELISMVLAEQSIQPSEMNDGRSTAYGYGWFLGELQGEKTISHGGGSQGYASHLVAVPDHGVFVVVLSNNPVNRPTPELTARRLAAIAIGKPLQEAAQVSLSADMLEHYEGCYVFASGQIVHIRRQGDSLVFSTDDAEPLILDAISENAFRFRDIDAGLRFQENAYGAADLVFLQAGSEIVASRCED